jgi:hypothetical protein
LKPTRKAGDIDQSPLDLPPEAAQGLRQRHAGPTSLSPTPSSAMRSPRASFMRSAPTTASREKTSSLRRAPALQGNEGSRLTAVFPDPRIVSSDRPARELCRRSLVDTKKPLINRESQTRPPFALLTISSSAWINRRVLGVGDMRGLVTSAAGLVLCVSVGTALCGCASTQLNYNTMDIANNSDSLLTKQILYNFATFLDNAVAVPAQIIVTSGTASTSASASSNVSAPFDRASTATETVAGVSATRTRTSSVASPTIGASGSDGWTQSYAFSPITDPDRMKRLDALYRYAVEWSANEETGNQRFVRNYPLIYKQVNFNEPLCLIGKKTADGSDAVVSVPVPVGKDKEPATVCGTSTTTNGGAVRAQTSRSYSTQAIDEHYLQGPTCVVCGSLRRLHINKKIAGSWLHWQDNRGGPVPSARTVRDGDIPLGTYGNYSFFVASDQAEKFVDFSIAVLSASTLLSGGAAGSAGGANAAASAAKSVTFTDPLTGQQFIGVPQ